ncbi:MAG: hypothetical protein EA392_13825 [Cryomorphaceae bacterium]|nr:MAG: hypothetical protein EA392_13825 [Cryomorphaceae bacterium]
MSTSANIKLIWDFRGPDAEGLAVHHEKHLAQYRDRNGMNHSATGCDELAPRHWIAWITVAEIEMITTRDALRPHRGEKLV